MVEGASSFPATGDVLAGKYELVRPVGKGGMGVVYEARNRRLGQRVAVKLLKADLLAHPECVKRFEREGRNAAQLVSAHVARVIDVDTTAGGVPFLVIEFLEGHDVQAELVAKGALAIPDAVDIVLQACSAMSEAHALGLVHRDLKPGNLFLCDKPAGTVKVLDFGVSKLLTDDEASLLTGSSVALGTPHYMSPEQAFSAAQVDARSDIWALGMILYRLISGRFPFDGTSPMAVVLALGSHPVKPFLAEDEVPRALGEAVMTALAKDRSLRFQHVDDLAAAIAPFGSGKHTFAPASRRPASPPQRVGDGTKADGDPTEGTLGSTWGDVDVPLPTASAWAQPPPVKPARSVRWWPRLAVLTALVVLGTAFGLSFARKRSSAAIAHGDPSNTPSEAMALPAPSEAPSAVSVAPAQSQAPAPLSATPRPRAASSARAAPKTSAPLPTPKPSSDPTYL